MMRRMMQDRTAEVMGRRVWVDRAVERRRRERQTRAVKVMMMMMGIEWQEWRWAVRIAVKMFVIMINLWSFLVSEKTSNLADDIFARRQMQIHERLQQFFAVLALCDLEGEQGIDIQESEIEAIGGESTEVWVVDCVSVRGDRVAGVTGKGQTERDAKRRNDFLPEATTGIPRRRIARRTMSEAEQSLRQNRTTQLSSNLNIRDPTTIFSDG